MTDFVSLRTAMVDRQIRPSDVTKIPVIDAMLSVPREAFVPVAMKNVAYAGEHINLGNGRVVLDPRVFAKMLDLLDVGPGDMVLDLACALGYSTAVISHMAEAVVGVEQNPDLATEAEENLSVQSVDNGFISQGALTGGAPKHGPYDAVLVGGGVETVPQSILDQLKVGGRIVAIFVSGASGICRLGLKTDSGVTWRPVFDATAPVLPGFGLASGFIL